MTADSTSAMSSAARVASHTPFTPRKAGRTSMAISMKTKEIVSKSCHKL